MREMHSLGLALARSSSLLGGFLALTHDWFAAESRLDRVVPRVPLRAHGHWVLPRTTQLTPRLLAEQRDLRQRGLEEVEWLGHGLDEQGREEAPLRVDEDRDRRADRNLQEKHVDSEANH